jgi:hypothetical protein
LALIRRDVMIPRSFGRQDGLRNRGDLQHHRPASACPARSPGSPSVKEMTRGRASNV